MNAQRIQWRWVVGCGVVGVSFIGAAFQVEAMWGWQGVAPGTLVEVGAALLLVGLLFLVERRFVRDVVRESERVVRAAEERFDERARGLELRLDDLQAATSDRVRERAHDQDAAIDVLSNVVSYATVTRALEHTNALNSLAHGRAVVEASANPEGPRLEFAWGWHPPSTSSWKPVDGPVLELAPLIERADSQRYRPVLEVEWRPDEDAATVGSNLIQVLQRNGYGQQASEIDWQVAVRNLQRTLRVAVSARRADPGGWRLNGELYELVGVKWAITTAGLESPPHNYILPAAAFPERPSVYKLKKPERPTDWPPPPPAWTTEEEWRGVLRRAEKRLPRESGPPFPTGPTWTPARGETESPWSEQGR